MPLSSIGIHLVGFPVTGEFVKVPTNAPAPLVSDTVESISLPVLLFISAVMDALVAIVIEPSALVIEIFEPWVSLAFFQTEAVAS